MPPRNIVLRSGSQRVLADALVAGVGIGFMPTFQAQLTPELHPVLSSRPDWSIPLWLVTHVDLHRTAKVQAIAKALLAEAEAFMPTD